MSWNWQQPEWPNFSWEKTRLAKAEAVLVCVPTPLTGNREPDLGPLIDCTRAQLTRTSDP